LVVIFIISVLLGMLMPAVQMARESARSTDCKNRLKQMGLVINGSRGEAGMVVTGYPDSIEQVAGIRLNSYLSICPSANLPEFIESSPYGSGGTTTYLGVLSGTATSEDRFAADGFFSTRDIRLVHDGTSHTVAIADAIFDFSVTDGAGDVVDHWVNPQGELSHTLGSTGVLINSLRRDNVSFAEKEISFGSRHPGGVNAVFVDGHVTMIRETIAREVWSALGTQAGGDSPFYD
jgi:prepilin-type processing-associated H-X9-DG protein